MNDTKRKGLTTELQCQLFFTSLGYNVSIPLGEDCKYDMVVDIDGVLIRVQVKTCREYDHGISISTKSVHMTANGNVKSTYTKKDIDYFATYFNGNCYLIPVELCGGAEKKLTFYKERRNHSEPCYIEDYDGNNIISRIKSGEYQPSVESVKIQQYDFDNNLIGTFDSYEEAGKSIGKPPYHINQCANGHRKTAYGYIWKSIKI